MHLRVASRVVAPLSARRRRLLLAGLGAALNVPALAQSSNEAEQPIIELLETGGATLEVQFAPGFDPALRDEARAWVQRSAGAVAAYFGRFPVPRAELLLVPVKGAGVGSGVSYGAPSPLVRVRLGTATTHAQFIDDWILVHEMVHLAVPGVPRSQTWLHEGIATYVESIARTRAGLIDAATMWIELARAMPQGLPQDGDHGLDHTPTWGRTYWGGAMFCLLADVQIRQRSGGRVGLQHALQGVLAAGGSYGVQWPIEKIVSTADASIGQSTLGELYALLKDCPRAINLDALWRDLGVAPSAGGAATLTDSTPLADVRRAITGTGSSHS
jgi:hypothetical protein